ncbi:MAG: alpha/beta fold hydrolase [Actinomycetota bacterium]|nr:alpha/beta fold hydrolase [Actinomycetota bacterium]
MAHHFESDGLKLVGRLTEPHLTNGGKATGLVLCHGFPSVLIGEKDSAQSYYDLADLISDHLGWFVFAITYRGCGNSEGNFSLQGWLNDTISAARHLSKIDSVETVYAVGFGTGGALAINAAALCEEISGVAAVSPPSDFNDWIEEPKDLLNYARKVGVITGDDYPENLDEWMQELSEIQTIESAGAMQGKPLLVLHGADDRVVPSFDARVIADAHGSADLRIIEGATHRLRFDPRTTAVLIGWLDRVNRSNLNSMTIGQNFPKQEEQL